MDIPFPYYQMGIMLFCIEQFLHRFHQSILTASNNTIVSKCAYWMHPYRLMIGIKKLSMSQNNN